MEKRCVREHTLRNDAATVKTNDIIYLTFDWPCCFSSTYFALFCDSQHESTPNPRCIVTWLFPPSSQPSSSFPDRLIEWTGGGNIVRIWKMHSLRCSRWRHRCWEEAKLSRLRFQSIALPWNEVAVAGGVAGTGKSRRNGQEWRRQTRGWNGDYRAVRHVSFFLIIIFNPIHCTVQQFALTPTYEILQGSLSDESIRGARWIRPSC